ncbi:hypothetical protein JOD63_000377 [Microbacterium terrae]|uniref:DNA primase/polymerase bifunctional N-terminal domain-containing protein n=1 Tax=Microbacterium terrae TaxID=69369 RepID=A0A0M2H1Y8_9MICO|nr:bifunctional DNA primase/polymerase [Microbacterium terrae]KJL37578.1 hypothetical protein RS81_03335 [Microbacterium terrae]MBP1076409.1 hypothetical protein [Microbacterium terrae]GLJ97236.1 DNA primase [Microbacterium terrae]
MLAVADLLFTTARMSRPEAALAFALADVPVFPCVPGGKRPLTRNGFHDASILGHVVHGWWRRWPEANIGMPTGRQSGVDVVDVDTKASGSGYATFQRAIDDGVAAGEFARVRTPSGGMHVYYVNSGIESPCWVSARAHIDFRGEGGYVLIPPSAVATDDGVSSYRTFSLSTARFERLDSTALRGFVDPRPATRYYTAQADRGNADALAVWVSHLREGERNRGLFWAACRLFDAGVEFPEAMSALAPVAEEIGLDRREINATVKSAWRRSGYDATIRKYAPQLPPPLPPLPRQQPGRCRSLS